MQAVNTVQHKQMEFRCVFTLVRSLRTTTLFNCSWPAAGASRSTVMLVPVTSCTQLCCATETNGWLQEHYQRNTTSLSITYLKVVIKTLLKLILLHDTLTKCPNSN